MKKLLLGATLLMAGILTSCGGKMGGTTIKIPTLLSITCECKRKPETFYVNEILRSSDLKVSAIYDNGEVDPAFGYKCDMLGYTFNEEDKGKSFNINVEFEGKKASTIVNVIEKVEPEVETVLEYKITEDRKGWEVYSNCVGKTVEIPSKYTYEEKDEEGKVIYSLTLPVVAIAEEGFSYSSNLESVKLPTSVKTINTGAFNGCNKLESINLSNVEKIGACAFTACNLQDLPRTNFSKLTNIGYQAFSQNKNLIRVDLRDSKVTTINPGCFALCDNLKEVSLPAITEIGSSAFNYCTHLTYIRLPNTNKADWYDIRKAYNWRINSSIKRVICADGDISLDEPEPEVIGTKGEILEDVSIQLTNVTGNNHTYKITSDYPIEVKKIYLGDEEVTTTVTNLEFTLSNSDNKKVTVLVEKVTN